MKRRTVLGGLAASTALLIPFYANANGTDSSATATNKRRLVIGIGGTCHQLLTAWASQISDARRADYFVFSEPFEAGFAELDQLAWATKVLSHYDPRDIRDAWLVHGWRGTPSAALSEPMMTALRAQGIPAAIVAVSSIEEAFSWPSCEGMEKLRASWRQGGVRQEPGIIRYRSFIPSTCGIYEAENQADLDAFYRRVFAFLNEDDPKFYGDLGIQT